MAEKTYEVIVPLAEHAPGETITAEQAGGDGPIAFLLATSAVRETKASKGGSKDGSR